jgi:hypothetical protein
MDFSFYDYVNLVHIDHNKDGNFKDNDLKNHIIKFHHLNCAKASKKVQVSLLPVSSRLINGSTDTYLISFILKKYK